MSAGQSEHAFVPFSYVPAGHGSHAEAPTAEIHPSGLGMQACVNPPGEYSPGVHAMQAYSDLLHASPGSHTMPIDCTDGCGSGRDTLIEPAAQKASTAGINHMPLSLVMDDGRYVCAIPMGCRVPEFFSRSLRAGAGGGAACPGALRWAWLTL